MLPEKSNKIIHIIKSAFFGDLGKFQHPFAVEKLTAHEIVGGENVGILHTLALEHGNNFICSVAHAVKNDGFSAFAKFAPKLSFDIYKPHKKYLQYYYTVKISKSK